MGLSSKLLKKARDFELDDSEDEEFLVNGAEEEEEEEEGEDGEEEYNNDEEDETEEGEENNDGEMIELEKEHNDLRNQELNLKRYKDEDVQKGQAVKNQKVLWDKTLEFRFLLQKAFSNSNRLPQDPVRYSCCDSDDGVSVAYSDVIAASNKTLDSLLELHENNSSIAQSVDGNADRSSKKLSKDNENLDMEDDEEWLRISQMNKRIAAFRDKAVDKWQRKTEVTTGAAAIRSKFEQVAAYMRDPSRMIKQMQQRRSTTGIFGAVTEGTNGVDREEAHPEGDPELLDDSEFYQQLLKEFFENVDPTSSAFYALKRLQTKKRKIVDRHASKSRKIRYNVHDKIVNFTASDPMKIPPMAPKLFENLFGLKTLKPISEF